MSKSEKKTESQPTAAPGSSVIKTIAIGVLLLVLGGVLLRNHLFQPAMYDTLGQTMGTDYHVSVCAESSWGWERTGVAIENELLRVNQMMSVFLTDSEISQFNDNPSIDWVEVSPELVKLVKLSKEVSQRVDGKFDITVGPLVDLWGFGAKQKKRTTLPTQADIEKALSIAGLDKLEYRESPPALKKAVPELRVNLSGVAKGYGVDCVAALLEKRGYTNYMIEIGGETRTRGHKVVTQEKTGWLSFFSSEKMNVPWAIGIKRPIPEGLFGLPIIELSVNLNDHAMATSGDAYSTWEIEGQRYTHIIDPTSGKAVQPLGFGIEIEGEEVGSVSVIAPTCAEADAFATGFYLLGAEKGIATADANGLAVAYLIRTGELVTPVRVIMSEAFKKSYCPEHSN